jgi:hypothetical protein
MLHEPQPGGTDPRHGQNALNTARKDEA